MSTSEVRPPNVTPDSSGQSFSLPDVAELAAMANEMFQNLALPTSVAPAVAPEVAPIDPVGVQRGPGAFAQPPRAPVPPTHPFSGAFASSTPTPGAPVAYGALPFQDSRGTVPPELLRPEVLSFVPAGASVQDLGSAAPSPAPGSVPTTPPDFSAAPQPLRAADLASPVPVPDDEALRQVPRTLGAVMGFVAEVPYTKSLSGLSDVGLPGDAASASGVASEGYRPTLAPLNAPITSDDLGTTSSSRPFDAAQLRNDFPILQEQVHGKRLIWLDNAATTQKPKAVIDRLDYFYEHENSNIHRAAHTLAARATDAYEGGREKVRRFINAESIDNVVFVRGTTEGINLIAQSWGKANISAGDEILITWLEHHANIVPWQQLCNEVGAHLRVVPVDDSGQVILSEYQRLIGPRTKLVSFTQVSNALGTITPSAEMIDIAHRREVPVLLDGAQSVPHLRADMQALDCDFFVFSGHKIFGPTGIGVVYGKKRILDEMPPWQGGGNMIADVTFERTVYQDPPARFEAGTGNIADTVGLGAALDYVSSVGLDNIAHHEHELLLHATEGLCAIPGLRIIGTATDKAGVISFVLDNMRPEDIGAALDREGIAVRSGHHCAQPILRRFGVEATVRPSFALYNTHDDVDALVTAVHRLATGGV